jgi:hypothetical protein
MDELALFDFALTPEQVAAHYAASGLSTQVVPGLFNTGVDDAGQLLDNGAIDPHYKLVQSSDPSYPGPNAVVPLSTDGFWYRLTVGSRWIAPAADESFAGAPSHPGGPYTYRLSIDLSGFDPASVHISGSWGADNAAARSSSTGSRRRTCATARPRSRPSTSRRGSCRASTIDFVVRNDAGGARTRPACASTASRGPPVPRSSASFPRRGALALAAPAPNPASGSTRLDYTLAATSLVLRWRHTRGEVRQQLRWIAYAVPPWIVVFAASVAAPQPLQPIVRVVYFVVLECEGRMVSRRLVWLR